MTDRESLAEAVVDDATPAELLRLKLADLTHIAQLWSDLEFRVYSLETAVLYLCREIEALKPENKWATLEEIIEKAVVRARVWDVIG